MSNLTSLPDIEFVNTDPKAIIDYIIGTFEGLSGETLARGDPRRLFLLSLAVIIIQQRQLIDQTGKSNLLYYAKGDYLDHLGAFRMVTRLPPSYAVTTMRVTASAVLTFDVGIPQGTRFSDDGGSVFFATDAPATIHPGETYVDIPAVALTAGVGANGVPVGVINRIVDPLPYIQSAANLVASQGGDDTEDDEAFRERIYQAPAAFSTAGPVEAYVYYAKSANPAIIDVLAMSPTPAVAWIYPLLDGGEIPGQAVLDEVLAVLNDETIRPLADRVEVFAPEAVPYSVDFVWYIRRQDQLSQAQISDRVNTAVAAYVKWQRTKIGRDIIPDELVSLVVGGGAKRLAINSPEFVKLEDWQIAQETTVNFIFGGVENE